MGAVENCSVVFQGAVGACSSRPRLRQLPQAASRIHRRVRFAIRGQLLIDPELVDRPAPRMIAQADAARARPHRLAAARRRGRRRRRAAARAGGATSVQRIARSRYRISSWPSHVFTDHAPCCAPAAGRFAARAATADCRSAPPSHSRPCVSPRGERPGPSRTPRGTRHVEVVGRRPAPARSGDCGRPSTPPRETHWPPRRSAMPFRRSFFTSRS